MSLVFWISIAAVAYVYVGYPAMLCLWAGLRPHPVERGPLTVGAEPGISIVVVGRNEGARLSARIDNLVSLDYPASRRQIIVVSDGSTDDTLDVLAPYRRFVEVVSVPAGGKALALNAGVERARHEILVFADARQVFAPDALRELVAPFADPGIGAVTGELRLDAESPCRRSNRDRRIFERRMDERAEASDRREDQRRRTLRSTIAEGLGMYWKYEKQMRHFESRIWSTLGATGAIYAVRRALYRPLPADTILDDVLTPMRVVLAGYRVVFNEQARAFDRAAIDADAEARRKVRTLAGNYQILALEPALLLPWRNPVWLQYVSHKLGRLVVPYALIAIFTASLILAAGHLFYGAVLAAQVLFYLLAGAGAILEFAGRRSEMAVPAAAPVRARRAVREIA
ncbi:MAG: glycosyl transferase [Acidobacteria bacterium]|nr:glycosyl transferase [Acidobacteriota bacterium]